MTSALGFMALAALMTVGGVAFSWAEAVRRRRIEDHRTLSTSYAELRKGAR